MEQAFFSITLIFLIFSYLISVKRIKWYHFVNVILISVYIPLILYLLNWSDLIYDKVCSSFYLIFAILNLICTLFVLSSPKPVMQKNVNKFKMINSSLFDLFLIIYVLLFFIENYAGSKSFFPTFQTKIDIHTYSMPIVSFFTRTPEVIMIFSFLFYQTTNQKKYIFYIIFIVFLWVVLRFARMVPLLACLKLFLFILIYYYYYNRQYFHRVYKKLFIVLLIIVVIFSLLTNFRMKRISELSSVYSDYIEYSGPTDPLGLLPVIYGYFPMSYDVLNRSLINLADKNINNQTYTLYTYPCIFMDFLQIDTIFGVPPQISVEYRKYQTGAATVATAFFDLFYDNGYYIFIPIFISLFLCSLLYIRVLRKQYKLLWMVLYSTFVSGWFLASFQNMIWGNGLVLSLVVGIFYYYLFVYERTR